MIFTVIDLIPPGTRNSFLVNVIDAKVERKFAADFAAGKKKSLDCQGILKFR